MKLYIMRHGDAVPYHALGDRHRPLTAQGQTEVIACGNYLADHGLFFEAVVHSPYIRAVQTWDCLATVLPQPNVVTCSDHITPLGDAGCVHDYLWYELGLAKYSHVLVVSHLPLVGELVEYYCPQLKPPLFYTAALSCLEIHEATGRGKLLWHHHAH